MPAHRKPTPERYCEYCGKRLERKRLPNGDLEYLIHFNRRLYCGRPCMAGAFKAKPKKPDPGWMTAHYHARNLKPIGPCEHCGAAKAEVHHRDEDWRNNSLANLQRLCRSCHNKAHRRKRKASAA